MKIVISNNNSFHNSRGGFLLRTIVLAVAVGLSAKLLPNVEVHGFWAAICTALVLSLLNNVVRPLLIFITLPVTLISLGLSLVVVNAAVIGIADWLLGPIFEVKSFGACIIFSLLVCLFNYLLDLPNRWLSRGHYQETESYDKPDGTIDQEADFDDYEEIDGQDD